MGAGGRRCAARVGGSLAWVAIVVFGTAFGVACGEGGAPEKPGDAYEAVLEIPQQKASGEEESEKKAAE